MYDKRFEDTKKNDCIQTTEKTKQANTPQGNKIEEWKYKKDK